MDMLTITQRLEKHCVILIPSVPRSDTPLLVDDLLQMTTILNPGPYTSRRLKIRPQRPSVKEAEADKKGRKRIENRTGDFLERTCHRSQGFVVPLRLYWARIDIMVSLMGAGVSRRSELPRRKRRRIAP